MNCVQAVRFRYLPKIMVPVLWRSCRIFSKWIPGASSGMRRVEAAWKKCSMLAIRSLEIWGLWRSAGASSLAYGVYTELVCFADFVVLKSPL